MRRREFIVALGGTAVAPFTATAQQTEPVRRVGVLINALSNDADAQARIGAFLQGLQEAGWSVGRNLRIDTRWGGGDAVRLRKQAAELVGFGPDAVLAGIGASVGALQEVSGTVPIVFAQVIDPVGAGNVVGTARRERHGLRSI
jgi:putative ABC transport system substrate-binding protein